MSTVLITGTSTGIGNAACEFFAKKGWRVYAGSRHPDPSLYQHDEIIPVELDVTKAEDRRRFFDGLGMRKETLDAVINNAGFGIVSPFEDMPAKQIEDMFRVNVFGAMEICREAIPLLREHGNGVLLNVSSMVGNMGYPWYAAYSSSKWALEGFSETLWYELRPLGIRVKLIEPGRVQTKFHAQAYDPKRAKEISERYRAEYEQKVRSHKESFQDPSRFVTADAVAQILYEAATDGSWRLRYRIGRDSKKAAWYRKFLPEQWFLERIFGMTGGVEKKGK